MGNWRIWCDAMAEIENMAMVFRSSKDTAKLTIQNIATFNKRRRIKIALWDSPRIGHTGHLFSW